MPRKLCKTKYTSGNQTKSILVYSILMNNMFLEKHRKDGCIPLIITSFTIMGQFTYIIGRFSKFYTHPDVK